jgi:hypothetical protein
MQGRYEEARGWKLRFAVDNVDNVAVAFEKALRCEDEDVGNLIRSSATPGS